MDYSKFLSDDFDHKTWINEAFKSCEPEQSKDQYASNLVMKLQIYMQEVNGLIDETCQQAVQGIPRVIREIESIRQEASLLQEQMSSVKTEIERVEKETSETMKTLVTIDTAKTRLQRAERALREADSWTALTEGLDLVIASGDIDKIAEKIVGLECSLKMLVSVPDYSKRVKRVEELKNTLETLLSPRAVQAFYNHDTVEATRYVRILKSVGRGHQADKYYQAWIKTTVGESWTSCLEGKSWTHGREVFDAFYTKLMELWQREVSSCIFSDTLSVVSLSLGESLDNTADQLDQFLLSLCQDAGDNPEGKIEIIAALMQSTNHFSHKIDESIADLNSEFFSTLICKKLASNIFIPYRGIVEVYRLEEKKYLEGKLLKIQLDHSDVGKTIDLLNASVSKVIDIAECALKHCFQLTFGVGLNTLFQCLQTYLESYVKEVLRVSSNIRAKSDQSEWDQCNELTFLHMGLRVTMVTGEFSLKCEQFIQKVIQEFTVHLKTLSQERFRHGVESPFFNYAHLLLDNTADQSEEGYTRLCDLVHEGGTPPLLASIRQLCHSLCENTTAGVYETALAPVVALLERLPSLDVWTQVTGSGEMLPLFAYSPHEDITKIGQFFLTLPQQLEPFLSNDSPSLAECLRRGQLPMLSPQSSTSPRNNAGAELWLEALARGSMHKIVEMALKIRELSDHGARQLTADLDYFISVMEDLDLSAIPNLTALRELVSIPSSEFAEVSADKPKQLVNVVRNMRNI